MLDALMPSLKVVHMAGFNTCSVPEDAFKRCHIKHRTWEDGSGIGQPFMYQMDKPDADNLYGAWPSLNFRAPGETHRKWPKLKREQMGVNSEGPMPKPTWRVSNSDCGRTV